jgi:hypothetical protein
MKINQTLTLTFEELRQIIEKALGVHLKTLGTRTLEVSWVNSVISLGIEDEKVK